VEVAWLAGLLITRGGAVKTVKVFVQEVVNGVQVLV
jgi:hypothetical protein